MLQQYSVAMPSVCEPERILIRSRVDVLPAAEGLLRHMASTTLVTDASRPDAGSRCIQSLGVEAVTLYLPPSLRKLMPKKWLH